MMLYVLNAWSNPEAIVRVRTTAAEDESLDRVSEAIFPIATRHDIRTPPHLRAGFAHENAKTTPLEHCDIIVTVADDRDLVQRNSQKLRRLR